MSCDIEAAPGGRVFRVGRAADPWAWPDWSRAGPDGTFGNRYDDPRGEYRVLYACSERVGALIEVLARFRTDPAVAAGLSEVDGDEADAPVANTVPRKWLARRVIGQATLAGRFADVGHSRSLRYLARQLAALALHFGLDELDAAAIRLRVPRGFTQAISRCVYECATDGAAQFAGIRYLSRLGDELVNWAVFERTEQNAIGGQAAASLESDDRDVRSALEHLGLRLE